MGTQGRCHQGKGKSVTIHAEPSHIVDDAASLGPGDGHLMLSRAARRAWRQLYTEVSTHLVELEQHSFGLLLLLWVPVRSHNCGEPGYAPLVRWDGAARR